MDNCFIPDGYERPHISSCQLHFSVCGSLPEGVCEGHPDTAACQEVVTFDGLRHYYSIGESQESYKFKPNGMDHSMYLITKFIRQFQCCNIFDSIVISYPIVKNHKLTRINQRSASWIIIIIVHYSLSLSLSLSLSDQGIPLLMDFSPSDMDTPSAITDLGPAVARSRSP